MSDKWRPMTILRQGYGRQTEASLQAARKNKYRNKPVVMDGIRFASKAEARRYGELKLLQRAGKIVGLEVHPSFDLTAGIKYVADFHYIEKKSGKGIAEDVKGVQTAVFRLKAKLFREFYPDCELRVVK